MHQERPKAEVWIDLFAERQRASQHAEQRGPEQELH
jgi:hypothetical protein